MKIALGGDHAGFPMKDPVREFLAAAGHAVEDFGTHSAEPVDFPDIARLVCDSVRDGKTERGVLVCGTGVGACIAGNKVPGIRAALCHDAYSAHQCVEHDDVSEIPLLLGDVEAAVVGPGEPVQGDSDAGLLLFVASAGRDRKDRCQE